MDRMKDYEARAFRLAKDFGEHWPTIENAWVGGILDTANTTLLRGVKMPEGCRQRFKSLIGAWWVNSCLNVVADHRYETPQDAHEMFNALVLYVGQHIQLMDEYVKWCEQFGQRPSEDELNDFVREVRFLFSEEWNVALNAFESLYLMMAIEVDLAAKVLVAISYDDKDSAEKESARLESFRKSKWETLKKLADEFARVLKETGKE